MLTLEQTLNHALIVYDARQAKSRYYNPHAFGQYFVRLGHVMLDIKHGADTRSAICAGFNGTLCGALLRAAKLPKYTREDALGGCVYQPLTEGARCAIKAEAEE